MINCIWNLFFFHIANLNLKYVNLLDLWKLTDSMMREINKTETCSRLNFRTKLIIGYTREETDWEVHKFPIQSTEEVAGVNETDRTR